MRVGAQAASAPRVFHALSPCLPILSGGLACLALLSVATEARAVGPVDVEIAGEVGTGTNPIGGTMNPQLGSVGARVGVVYRHVYVGADLLEEFGGFVDYGNVAFGQPHLLGRAPIVKSQAFGARLGYGFAIEQDDLVVRPQLGIGDYIMTSYLSGTPVGDTSPEFGPPTSALYLEPGVCVLGLIGHVIHGADANVLIESQAGTEPALTAHLQAGVRF